MQFSNRDPMDIPAPPTIDDVSRLFAVPVMTFVPQPSLSELGVGTIGSSSNGGPTSLDSVAISYTLWRNPADRDDPVNLAELTETARVRLATQPPNPLPEWMIQRRNLSWFPALWEAVMTSRVRADVNESTETILVNHVNHVLANSFHDERVVGDFPGDLTSPASARSIEHVAVTVDDVELAGMRIDTDPHVYGIGVFVDDRVLTSVVPREFLPYLTVAFATRALPTQ